MLEGFLFYYNFVSADSCGFARRGGTRSSEGRFPSSRSSPPATGNGLLPALRAKRLLRTGCVTYSRFLRSGCVAYSRFLRSGCVAYSRFLRSGCVAYFFFYGQAVLHTSFLRTGCCKQPLPTRFRRRRTARQAVFVD